MNDQTKNEILKQFTTAGDKGLYPSDVVTVSDSPYDRQSKAEALAELEREGLLVRNLDRM